MTSALIFIHKHDVCHGNLSLKDIILMKNVNETGYEEIAFILTNIKPGYLREFPMSISDEKFLASGGSLKKIAKKLTHEEKLTAMKLKDIYYMGVCILELMIGKTADDRASISLDSVPQAWTDLVETTTIVQILGLCFDTR